MNAKLRFWTPGIDRTVRSTSSKKARTLTLWGWGTALVALGRPAEGVELLVRANTPSHRGRFVDGTLGWALASAGRTDEAREVLERLRARPAPAPVVLSQAWLLAALGEHDEAWEILEAAEQEHHPFLNLIGLPGFDAFRNTPRFEALLERIGLPTTTATAGGKPAATTE